MTGLFILHNSHAVSNHANAWETEYLIEANRNRRVIYVPQQDDINGIKAIYG